MTESVPTPLPESELTEVLLAELAELVGLESPTGRAGELNRLADRLCAGLASAGAAAARVPGPAGDHVVARWPGRVAGGHVLVVGHHDTVWPLGTLAGWPYTVSAGRATGPGAYDMKAGLVILRAALALLSGRPAHPVVLVSCADEEIGSPDGARLVERHLDGARAVLGLEPPHPDGALKTGRRGSARVRISVTGREAHSGLDAASGVSAVDELVDQLLAIRSADLPGVEVNVGTVAGGSRANVIAGQASAELGLRFTDPAGQIAALGLAERLVPIRAGAAVAAQVLSFRPAWPAPDGSALLEHVRAAGSSIGQQVVGAPALGAGDTNLPGSCGIPTLDGFGAPGAGAHARHEQVELAGLGLRALLLAAVLARPLPDDLARPMNEPAQPMNEQAGG